LNALTAPFVILPTEEVTLYSFPDRTFASFVRPSRELYIGTDFGGWPMQERSSGGREKSPIVRDTTLTPEQVQGLQHGVGASIMPVSDGWRVHYFSIPTFEEEPGTTFPDFDSALAAIKEVLPPVNTEEQRERAREQLSSGG
jgi:hypothetical protein